MLRVASEDELAADLLWSLGAVAVFEDDGAFVAGFASDEDEQAALSALDVRTTTLPVTRMIDDHEWADAWRQHAKPVTVGSLTVRPAWIEGRGIAIEPGEAFGIGSHPTTRLAIEALTALVEPGDTVLDVGTGTGVLSIVAVELGAAAAVAVDIDAHAVEVARANVARNDREGQVDVRTMQLADLVQTFDVVVANLGGLLAPLELAPLLAARTRRVLVVSGLLVAGNGGASPEPLDDALARVHLALASTWTRDGWTARAYASSVREEVE